MIVIKMTFLAGRYHATPWGSHVNEGAVEYPPSPWRLLRALISVYHRARPDGVSANALTRVVEALSAPPLYRLPRAAAAHTRHYDQANNGIKFFDTFVALDPEASILWQWKDAKLDEADRTALRTLLVSLGTFGRAESWCEATLLDNATARKCFDDVGNAATAADDAISQPLGNADLPAGYEPVRVLIPAATGTALMESLLDQTSSMRKRRQLDPPGSRWLTYTRPLHLLEPRGESGRNIARSRSKVTVLRFALHSNVLPLVQDTLPFAEQVRRAVLRHIDGMPHSEVLTGKTVAGIPLEGHQHVHYLPTDEDCDGRIDHLTVYAPRGFSDDEQDALGQLSRIFRRGNRPDVRLVLTGLGELSEPKFEHVELFALAQRWCSMTPFVLPRFPTRGSGKAARPRDTAEGQLRRLAYELGLPEIVAVVKHDQADGCRGTTGPHVRWPDFTTRRFNGTRGHGVTGFEVEFSQVVRGPLSLGFGSHFGLGLFLPSRED
jgi:CRISPR-associated protein Csb2